MEEEFTVGQMEENLTDNGKTENNMGKVYIYQNKEKFKKEFGKMEKE